MSAWLRKPPGSWSWPTGSPLAHRRGRQALRGGEDGPRKRKPFSRTGGFRNALAKAYLNSAGQLPQASAMSAAVGVLEEKAGAAGLDPADEMVAALDPSLLQEQDSRPSAATRLVGLALDNYDLGCTHDGEPFAVPRAGARIVRVLRGGRQSLRAELAGAYFGKFEAAAPRAALADACAVLEGRAQQLDPTELHLRVAQRDGHLVLDLGDATGRAVVTTPRGWSVVDEPPVMFRRTALTGALPAPVRGGTLDVLWPLLNVRPEYRPILTAVLVASLVDNIPHPITDLAGEQGSRRAPRRRRSPRWRTRPPHSCAWHPETPTPG